MELPTTARRFIAFMEEVWEGGELYDEWHDAVRSAERCGMRRTGSTQNYGDGSKWWGVYRFPDADDGVAIQPDGNALSPTKNRRKRDAHLSEVS